MTKARKTKRRRAPAQTPKNTYRFSPRMVVS
jgi:hypothetical protein